MTLEDDERSIWFFPFFTPWIQLSLSPQVTTLPLAWFRKSASYPTRISISNPLDISLIYFQQEKIWAAGRIVCDPICFSTPFLFIIYLYVATFSCLVDSPSLFSCYFPLFKAKLFPFSCCFTVLLTCAVLTLHAAFLRTLIFPRLHISQFCFHFKITIL